MNGYNAGNDDDKTGHGQICCLVDNGSRCARPAANACYNKRIQKIVTQKKLKLYLDNSVRHIYICDYHKGVIQSMRSKRKRRDSDDGSGSPDHENDLPEIDLFQLPVNTLRRYKRHFKIPTQPGLSKSQLADSLMKHFRTIPVVEKEALTYFIYMVKSHKSKLDNKPGDSASYT
ncbi:PREDICTED: histone deacetylase complex subunit SAP30L-like [Priapulus caudatus]|uniref:Histone deacetylase complex subunit SAP30L-like n=1 Tax=Priapulus caudatus TaxID=37621 RepID=A0ABM1EF78_PRICU|nr:PREDICTED: histone deacetylase complex subunit SAP30L-like [Priapulus caudatus]